MEGIMSGLLKWISKPFVCIYIALLISVFFSACSTPSFYVQKEPAKGVYHRVKKGETLWSIAHAYGMKTQDLAEVNNISKPDLIEEGSAIFIPDANQVIDDVMASVKTAGAEVKTEANINNVAVDKPQSIKNNKINDLKDKTENLEKKAPLSVPPKPTKTKLAKVTPPDAAISPESAPAIKPGGDKIERKSKAKPPVEEKEEDVQFEKKRFIWPVRGSVKTRFGIQPNKTYHNWIKIVSTTGTQVKSAASGTVIFSSSLPQFGETIIIRHADNFATVYAHLKKRYVKSDQNVKKGDVIALVGETDEAGDVYMNFEVRYNKKPRNPLFFLP